MSNQASIEITGGCHCGAIRYTAEGPVHHHTHCHCSICRAFGGTLMSWITVEKSRFRLTKGSPKTYHSSTHAHREFCSACGTQLTFNDSNDCSTIDIAIGSLDNPEDFSPDKQIWVCSRLPYLTEINNLPMSLEGGAVETSGKSKE